ncbi:hypothetical protein B0F90DRAFT_1730613, partial [Multifurca ochricompacta]
MAPFKSSGKSTAKRHVWVHDRAPGAPRNATHNKLMITNLHYEITPKDLTVCSVHPLGNFGQIGTLHIQSQPISIEFDQGGPRHARAPASSLLSRIQKPPLLIVSASLIQSKRVSSIRGRGRGPGTGPARGRISTPLPKSAAELDSELDAFMSPAENGDMEMA